MLLLPRVDCDVGAGAGACGRVPARQHQTRGSDLARVPGPLGEASCMSRWADQYLGISERVACRRVPRALHDLLSKDLRRVVGVALEGLVDLGASHVGLHNLKLPSRCYRGCADGWQRRER